MGYQKYFFSNLSFGSEMGGSTKEFRRAQRYYA
jgi:hypothetical protein